MLNNSLSQKIAIDCRTLLGPQTGIARYTQQLINQLHELEVNLSLYYNEDWHQKTPVRLNKNDNFFPAITRIIPRKLHYYLKFIQYFKDQKTFKSSLNQFKPSIIHFPDFFGFKTDIPTVVTIHDISCIKHPEFHPYSRVKWHEKMLPQTISYAQHIITVSNYSKSEIIKYLGVPDDKISVTYNGVSEHFTRLPEKTVISALHKYQLKYKQYLLYVGTLEPRKNLQTILKAFTRLPRVLQTHYPLVLSGLKGWKVSNLLTQYRHHIEDGRIHILGFVPANDLPSIYNGATLFLYPSFYEGFGLPPLEAMSCGTPTLVSNKTSLPEVVGKAGIILEADDYESWAKQIQEVVENVALAKKYAKAGIQQAQLFTWRKCAFKTLEIYELLQHQ